MRQAGPYANDRPQLRPAGARRGFVPANFRSVRPPFQQRREYGFPPPVDPLDFHKEDSNFLVDLVCAGGGSRRTDVEGLISKCKSVPENFVVYVSGTVAARLFFGQWVEAREAMVSFWELRLDGAHLFTPSIKSSVLLPSDVEELRDALKSLFADRVRGFLDGDAVKVWRKKLEHVLNEMAEVSSLLGKPNKPGVAEELVNQRKGLICERDLILNRINEFKSAMSCILAHLEGKKSQDGNGEGLEVFRFEGDFNWSRIHCLMLRECKRLEDGLPIYAFRQQILRQIQSHQIMVLVGETGSGKSTQLVQFLADSGVASTESIICTQPRKIAAISLARRVAEESSGCYKDNSIICCPAYSSIRQFDSKVIYMTDHCLLQHYMSDKKFSGISCIIVDEAHERSLNTDLLLALVRDCLLQNHDLRLLIMSATADAKQLSDYFFGCNTFHVVGRSFPVDLRYVPSESEGSSGSGIVASYVSDVLRMVAEIHKTEKEGTILAFLTSQMEVEWARENFRSASAVSLALHGKLSYEEQFRVFQNYSGKRKVIFATNLAETSLTIPGVRYVVDPGMVKESRFEPGSGMNILRVCRTSKSSANQRTGRAGRTEPGKCYRLYSEGDFELMPPHQEPEICRVHLGVAVLRILALGMKNVQNFNFIDAPSAKAIDMATRNLIQLGAITWKNEELELTEDGHHLVKLGIEPRLGKLILGCFRDQLGREGLVLAAVMANASSIFCRVGNGEDKLKSDCLKVQFCHCNGDLFTLLSVYKEWESLPSEKKNKWCWENSINAKSMRRCHETVIELEQCLQNEINFIIPSYWHWNPHQLTFYDKKLKKNILSSLAENVAMYSGYDRLGYEVALTGQHVQLHPSCSLLIFGEKPQWVVFSEILSISNKYLVCVTAFDFESISTLFPPPLYDVGKMESQKLQVRIISGFGSTLLKKFCGKFNNSLHQLVSRIRTACMDERIGIEVKINQNEILLYASSHDMEKAFFLVNDALEYERKWLQNECTEKCLYHGGPGISPSVALFGAGAQIKHLELEKRCLTVDVSYSNVNSIDDKELLIFFEKYTYGSICAIHKFTGSGQDSEDKEKSSKITFLSPDAARKAAELNGFEFKGTILTVIPSRMYGGDHKMFSFPAVKAKVYWPRRRSKGFAIVKCNVSDVSIMVAEFSSLYILGNNVRCEVGQKSADSVVISGIDKDISEAQILDILRKATNRRILDFFLVRGDCVESPPCGACEEALLKEISHFMPKGNPHGNRCRIHVFPPEPKDCFMRGMITFDGRLHLEAAKALEQIEGKVLPGCFSWQKIMCQRLFHSFVSCPAPVYFVIKKQLDSLLARFRRQKGVECNLDRNENGSYRVKISANATKTVAELRKPLEELMKGKSMEHSSLTPTILQLLFSRDGMVLMKSIQRETGTFIIFDRQSLNVKVFGPADKIVVAEQRLIQCLLTLHESKQLEISLRGRDLPPDLMKQVVKVFGPELHGLKEKVPGAEFTLDARRHMIYIHGNKELKQKVEHAVQEIAEMTSGGHSAERLDGEVASCPICLCELEDSYQVEACTHSFCRLCLVEQCESAIKNQDGFPVCCANEGCRAPILLTDLRSLLSCDKLEELFRAAMGAYVASSGGMYRFCPSPDCPAVYRVADPGTDGEPFLCGSCYAETCTRCHMEYHPFLSCERYQAYKEDPDSSLKEWCKGKENVKLCPVCGHTIEKVDGCNHIECRCGKHICWNCLEFFGTSDDCYGHLRSVHQAII
ncbi:ATP-dependent RNA helicase DEAH12, chloroplastic-like [Malania oleifera]|uniref:ATP-dependent RNA helicase DEAH12, chloroplastic-like n=1 Tax=Malania oleifera TaxID=397392 RepID=UPI0025AE856D|nr:ATP-dependent RNA helicase DEAH12, chloroplastic-like [Malania oleifera]